MEIYKSILLEKKIKINRTITMDHFIAKAIEDEARAKILQLLYKKQLNAEQITNRLRKLGYKRAVTTIRHHIEILKDAGLIEVIKIVESRGAVIKYYGTSTKLLPFLLPENFLKKNSRIIELLSPKLQKILTSIPKKAIKFQKSNQTGYNDYMIIEIINHIMTNLLEKR